MGRSYLVLSGQVASGGDSEHLDRALGQGADALVVDLSGVAVADGRDLARKVVATWLRSVPAHAQVWVRIRPGPVGHDDARVLVGPGLRGLCVSKTNSPVQLDALDAVLSTAEAEAGLRARSVLVAPALASAGAVLAAVAIARSPRVMRLHLDEAELRAELGVEPSRDDRELLWVRSQIVLASAAAGLEPPVGAPSTDRSGLDRLRESTLALRRLGFRGRACLDAAHVPVVNGVFG